MASEPLVFPVGHFGGTFFGADDPDERHHEVRLAAAVLDLSDEELRVWALAHGIPDDVQTRPWTRTTIAEVARSADLRDVDLVLDGLRDRGLIAEVAAPDQADLRRFASSHQVIPLMTGLGNSPDEPWLYSIGLPGLAVLQSSRPIYSLLVWGHLDYDLWSACQTYADVERAAGAADPVETDPAQVLAGFVATLHGLLSVNACYLDTRDPNLATTTPASIDIREALR